MGGVLQTGILRENSASHKAAKGGANKDVPEWGERDRKWEAVSVCVRVQAYAWVRACLLA